MPKEKNTEKRKRVLAILFAVLAALTIAGFAAAAGYVLRDVRNAEEGIEAAMGVMFLWFLLLWILPVLLAAECLLWRSGVYLFCADKHPWYRTVFYSFYALVAVSAFDTCFRSFGMLIYTSTTLLYTHWMLLIVCAVLKFIDMRVTRVLTSRGGVAGCDSPG